MSRRCLFLPQATGVFAARPRALRELERAAEQYRIEQDARDTEREALWEKFMARMQSENPRFFGP